MHLLALPIIKLSQNIGGFEAGGQLLGLFEQGIPDLRGGLRRQSDRNDNGVDGGYPRRKDEALVVAVNHYHDTDHTC